MEWNGWRIIRCFLGHNTRQVRVARSYFDPMEDFAIVAIIYALFCICLVFPPTEFASAGLTLETIFSSILGDESLHFFDYHLRRTSFHLFCHSCLPVGFFAVLFVIGADFPNEADGSTAVDASLLWRILFSASVLLPIGVGTLLYFWSRDDWRRHPAVGILSLYDAEWRNVASAIGTEYRRLDKFTVTLGGVTRVIVTDSWIIYVGLYQIKVTQQAEARLTVIGADEHDLSHLSETQVQFITILVENSSKPIPSFKVRLNSLNYREMKNKLQSPIETARNVIIRMSLDDRFVEAFRQHAENNPPYVMDDERKQSLEPCIGCMQEVANVKLEKLCMDVAVQEVDQEGRSIPHCRQCYCRPMWCLSCMGRWFASRQDPRQPERWLAGKSPCPTCRATFCVLDVSLVQ